jgi:hypothetical protein
VEDVYSTDLSGGLGPSARGFSLMPHHGQLVSLKNTGSSLDVTTLAVQPIQVE